MSKIILHPEYLEELVTNILERHNTSYNNAVSVAKALLAAEIDRQSGHGLFRIESYVAQLKTNKIDGQAVVETTKPLGGVVQVDANFGFAYPAFDIAIKEVVPLAKKNGIAIASIFHSHHCGMGSYHVERIADEGCCALLFANSPKAIAPWGGKQGIFGTNPIAFAVPRSDTENDKGSFVIDLSLSKIARGKILHSSKQSDVIAEGIALDINGNPTTSAREALKGTMLPIGDAKGYALCFMVEILSACLSGSNIGCEASSLLDDKGGKPNIGQSLIVFNQDCISRDFFAQKLELLFSSILKQENTRLPGDKRFNYRRLAKENGLEINAGLMGILNTLNQEIK